MWPDADSRVATWRAVRPEPSVSKTRISIESILNGMGRPSLISRPAILEAGMAIADTGGLDAVTMQAVAERLGVTPMALYRHVGTKADLLDGLVELLLTEFPLPPPGLAWQDRLGSLARAVRATAHRHPAVFPLLLKRPATTPGARQVRDEINRGLEGSGVGAGRVAQVERLVSTAILGFVASEVSGRFANHSARQLDDDFALLERMLLGFIEAATQGGRDPTPRP